MKRAYLYLYMLALASFFFGAMRFSAGNLRFVFIMPVLLFAVIQSARFPERISSNVTLAIWIFLGWCLLTCFWSENFTMSIVKLGLFACTVLAFCIGGMLLPEDHPEMNPFLPLAPIFCYVVIGSVISPNSDQGNFNGVSGNSNMFAACILFSMPWYLLELQRRWSSKHLRIALLVMGAAALFLLVLSRSRTMMVAAVAGSILIFQSLKPGRKILLTYALVVMLVLAVVFSPNLLSTVKSTYVMKSGNRLMESREEQMVDSYQYAKQGGTLGAGYGVSIGMGRYWEMGSTFSNFSREKGNSIFAIVEEIGVVGLALWLALLLLLTTEVRSLGRDLDSNSPARFVYLVSLGSLLSAFVSSMAEAWVLSPSPETAVFWATVGISVGALRREMNRPQAIGRAA